MELAELSHLSVAAVDAAVDAVHVQVVLAEALLVMAIAATAVLLVIHSLLAMVSAATAVLHSLLAVDNFNQFKNLMVQRNIYLQKKVVRQLEIIAAKEKKVRELHCMRATL